MTITVEQIKQTKLRSARMQRLYRLVIILACFALINLATGNISLWQIPVLIEAVFVYLLLGNSSINKMLGEFERPKRSTFNKWFTFSFVIVLFIPLAFFMLNMTNELLTNFSITDFQWENLLVLTPGPLLLALIRQLPLKNENESNQKIILAVVKKITMSSICLIGFLLIMLIVNSLGIDPAQMTDSFSDINWLTGSAFFWSANFLFYAGAALFLFAVGDVFSLLEEGT